MEGGDFIKFFKSTILIINLFIYIYFHIYIIYIMFNNSNSEKNGELVFYEKNKITY